MNRQEIAVQLLRNTTDPEERVSIMIKARLGEQLIAELPALIESGMPIRFGLYSSPANDFNDVGPGKTEESESINGLYLWLFLGKNSSVHFAGLINVFGDRLKAAEIVEKLLRRCSPDALREGELLAARAYLSGTELHRHVELCALGNLLRGPVAVSLATRMLLREVRDRAKETGHAERLLLAHTPVEDWLMPLVVYLADIGVEQDAINQMILSVLSEEKNLCTLEKVVSLVGSYHDHNDKGALANVLNKQGATILRLQFKCKSDVVLTKHLAFLVGRGFKFHGDVQAITDVFVDEISRGNVSTVLHHLLLFVVERPSRRAGRHPAQIEAGAIVARYLPAAFKKAMSEERYGVAAALAQLDLGKVTTPEEAMRAIQLAIVMGQPIRLDWNRFVMPWTVAWGDFNEG